MNHKTTAVFAGVLAMLLALSLGVSARADSDADRVPTNLKAVGIAGGVRVSWDPPVSTNPVLKYEVSAWPQADSGGVEWELDVDGGTYVAEFTDIDDGTPVRASVVVEYVNGEKGWSEVVNAITGAPIVPAPTQSTTSTPSASATPSPSETPTRSAAPASATPSSSQRAQQPTASSAGQPVAAPGRPAKLRLKAKQKKVIANWQPTANADRYLVKVRTVRKMGNKPKAVKLRTLTAANSRIEFAVGQRVKKLTLRVRGEGTGGLGSWSQVRTVVR